MEIYKELIEIRENAIKKYPELASTLVFMFYDPDEKVYKLIRDPDNLYQVPNGRIVTLANCIA